MNHRESDAFTERIRESVENSNSREAVTLRMIYDEADFNMCSASCGSGVKQSDITRAEMSLPNYAGIK